MIDSPRLTDEDREFWRHWSGSRRIDVGRLRRLEERAVLEVRAFVRLRRYVSVSWGTDSVVTAVSVGGPAYYGEPYRSEIYIPRKYGVDQFVGPVRVRVCGLGYRR